MGYGFKDVGRGAVAPAQRSAESLALDGVYLEDVIPGFRVLYTKGREILGYSLETATLPGRNGELTLGGRWPSRTVVVGYQLIARVDHVPHLDEHIPERPFDKDHVLAILQQWVVGYYYDSFTSLQPSK